MRTRRGERTHTGILDAARSHLLESGPDGFSLREVARRAELAPSAIYNHFPSKDALVNELAMEAVGLLGAYLESVPKGAAARERLRLLGDAYLRFARDEPQRYRIVFDLLVAPSSRWEPFAEVAYPFSVIVATVADGLAAGELVDADSQGASAIAYGLWSLMHGFVMLSAHHLANIEDDFSPLQDAAVRAYLGGLTKGPKPHTRPAASKGTRP